VISRWLRMNSPRGLRGARRGMAGLYSDHDVREAFAAVARRWNAIYIHLCA